jgi:uncharacterized phage-associated protein
MAGVLDVAEYMLKQHGQMTAMKLQKLVYYAQAWSLVWDEKPLFEERIEAWANGPVCPVLYRAHAGRYSLDTISWASPNPDALSPPERETIDIVLTAYGDRTSQWLSDLTHSEAPWKDARRGLADGARGNNEITHAAMAEYFESLSEDTASLLG